VKLLNEFKNILETSNTYLKARTGFYIFWQLVSVLFLGVSIWGIWMLLGQLKGIAVTFGI